MGGGEGGEGGVGGGWGGGRGRREGEGKGARASKPYIVGYSLTNVNCQQTTNQRLVEKRGFFCITTFKGDEY